MGSPIPKAETRLCPTVPGTKILSLPKSHFQWALSYLKRKQDSVLLCLALKDTGMTSADHIFIHCSSAI